MKSPVRQNRIPIAIVYFRPSPWVYCFSELDLVLYRDDRVPTLSVVNRAPTETSNLRFCQNKKQSTGKKTSASYNRVGTLSSLSVGLLFFGT